MKQSGEGIQSPCVGNCCLDDKDVCLGCFRHLEEIKAWATADDQERQKIIRAATQRGKMRNFKQTIFR
ncbi:MAG: DUF1289 domain-containing protein [Gammaproteobacteria bacterium]